MPEDTPSNLQEIAAANPLTPFMLRCSSPVFDSFEHTPQRATDASVYGHLAQSRESTTSLRMFSSLLSISLTVSRLISVQHQGIISTC